MDQFRTFLIIIASFLFLPAEAANGQDTKDIKYINDSLLHVLDKAIADSKALREQREERISTLQATYNSASSWSVRYDIAQQLYQLTRTYKTDLALHYLHLSLNAAERLRDNDKADKCKCQLMEQ